MIVGPPRPSGGGADRATAHGARRSSKETTLRRALLLVIVAGASFVSGCATDQLAVTPMQRGLVVPTSLAFAPDGRVFVAEKRGTIQTYDSVDDPSPEVFADLRLQVQNDLDHGLLGIEVDRQWPARPYVYILYSYDAPPGGTAPVNGGVGDTDACGDLDHYCPAQGRIARLTAGPDHRSHGLDVLVQDVCQPYGFHGGGGLRQAPDGSLVAAFGESASTRPLGLTNRTSDICDDPVGEKGSMRPQDIRTPADPTGLAGTVIRIDPDTGEGWPTNPNAASSDPNVRRIIAHGARNPFRLALRPRTSEVWVGDVGSNYAEEINRVGFGTPMENLGWPCMEGTGPNPDEQVLHRWLCDSLYLLGGETKPYYSYCHGPAPGPGQPCGAAADQAAISGLEFYDGANYGDRYRGALFFADYAKNSIRVMLPTDGTPDPTKVEDFVNPIGGGAVDLRVGPGGYLYYVDIFGGTIGRIHRGAPPPVDTATPVATIDSPGPGATYRVGDTIRFSGRAADASGSPLPPSTLRWQLIQLHCPDQVSCHRHFADSREGVASGSFVAPAHENPSKLELALTATVDGRTDTTTVIIEQVYPASLPAPAAVAEPARAGRTATAGAFLVG